MLEQLLATGCTIHACMNLKTHRLERLPEELEFRP